MTPLLEAKDLSKRFPVARGLFGRPAYLDAVSGVSFQVLPGETVALVGESGSGKSTLGKMVQGLLPPTSGAVLFEGADARAWSPPRRARWVQTIFQDPFASLNPKLSVGTTLDEALALYARAGGGGPRPAAGGGAAPLLASVGLEADFAAAYPHQLSGGQRQRVGIARALAMRPRLIVADEPVSALDVSVQAQILALLLDLQRRHEIAMLLIGHDLAVVERMAARVLVMRAGRIVEAGPVRDVFSRPQESYTRELLAAIPRVAVP